MQLYNDVNSELHCLICTFYGGSARDVQRHASRMHPDVVDFNWPLGDKRHRYAPAGTMFCNTCQIFIGSYSGESHKLNARHRYLCQAIDAASEGVTTIGFNSDEADTAIFKRNENADVDPFSDGVDDPDYYGVDDPDSPRTHLVITRDSGKKY